ncbi:MAG TPA: L-histidine N(alpha)-methyltransferase [Candidatus Eisenbacteria bacterium]|nr:L-histidine N(alpha)-methyltransferase [Candidatus Eisenbacteria bacterium]
MSGRVVTAGVSPGLDGQDNARAVRAGLSGAGRKSLPSRLLYDDLGSALFEAITRLPEYGLTRADERLLTQHAAEIATFAHPPLALVELGSGSGRKARPILEAMARRQSSVTYRPIDLSEAALDQSRVELGGIEGVVVEPILASYGDGLSHAVGASRPGERLLVLFLGGTIGNFDRDEAVRFLADIRSRLRPGDALLVGADLMKPAPQLIAAYDDALGVTAAFNKNVLVRLNRELAADFDPAQFDHEARWNEAERRVEMHLVSKIAQSVALGALGSIIHFKARETIWTESSYRYEKEELPAMAARAGFDCLAQWVDATWPFAETLLTPR